MDARDSVDFGDCRFMDARDSIDFGDCRFVDALDSGDFADLRPRTKIRDVLEASRFAGRISGR